VIDIERVAGLEVQGVLPSLGAEPEAIFAAEHVHVRQPLARLHRGRPIQPKLGASAPRWYSS